MFRTRRSTCFQIDIMSIFHIPPTHSDSLSLCVTLYESSNFECRQSKFLLTRDNVLPPHPTSFSTPPFVPVSQYLLQNQTIQWLVSVNRRWLPSSVPSPSSSYGDCRVRMHGDDAPRGLNARIIIKVNLGFTELLFIQIDFCVMCVLVLYTPLSLSSCPFLDILHCLSRAVGVPLESAFNIFSLMSARGAHDTHACCARSRGPGHLLYLLW